MCCVFVLGCGCTCTCVCVCVCACVAIGNYRLCVYKTIYDEMPYVCVEQLKL